MSKIIANIVKAVLLGTFIQFSNLFVDSKISAQHLRLQLHGLIMEADDLSVTRTGKLHPLVPNQAGGHAGGWSHPAEVMEPGGRGRGKEEKRGRGQGKPRRGGKQFGDLRQYGPSCGPSPALGSAQSRGDGGAR